MELKQNERGEEREASKLVEGSLYRSRSSLNEGCDEKLNGWMWRTKGAAENVDHVPKGD